METSTPENQALVSETYTRLLQDRSEGRDLPPPEQLVYEVEMLTQEVNSGASFEQYFRWASVGEIRRAAGHLEALGLAEPARLVRAAVAVAFPAGLPASDADMDALTAWDEAQEKRLALLAEAYAEHNGALTNALARWYRRTRGV